MSSLSQALVVVTAPCKTFASAIGDAYRPDATAAVVRHTGLSRQLAIGQPERDWLADHEIISGMEAKIGHFQS